MKQTIFFLTLMLLNGCVFFKNTENHSNAYYIKRGSSFEITVSGTRFLMSHHPISALSGKTYVATHTFIVPRITGIVTGDEIPRKKGYYKYIGTIEFTDSHMIINLQSDNYDNDTKHPISWNGIYKLNHRVGSN